jgi:predicted RNA methylase
MTPGGVEAEARAHLAWLRAQGTGLDDAALRVAVVWAFARAVARARGLGPKLARLWRVRAVALGLSPTVWDGADAPTCSAHDPVQLGTAYEALRAEGRRAAGRYYTPAALAAAVVARACAAVSSRDASQWAVCDPACGGGAFLLAALDVLGEGGARRCWGADIDAGAAETARLSVWLAAGGAAGLWPALGRQIVAGDALAEGTLRDGRFDLVVGNPPWLAYAGRAAAPLTREAREAMRRRYRAMAGFPTLHGAFLQRAMELAAEGGAMGMLVPTPVADLAGYGPTRAAVRCHGRVCKPLDDLSESFPGVGVSVHGGCGGEGRAGGARRREPVGIAWAGGVGGAGAAVVVAHAARGPPVAGGDLPRPGVSERGACGGGGAASCGGAGASRAGSRCARAGT